MKLLKGYLKILCVAFLILKFAPVMAEKHSKAMSPKPAGISLQSTTRGEVFANTHGQTLYFNSTRKSICKEDCAKQFSPFPAAALARDVGKWTIVTRNDVSRQWAYKGKLLFTYGEDRKPGQVNGIQVLSWQPLQFAKARRPKIVSVRQSLEGPALTTNLGMTLYVVENPGLGFTRAGIDQPRESICKTDCLQTWRPLKARKKDRDIGLWSVITRPDKTLQWAYDHKAVYTSTLDLEANDANGHLEQIYQDDGRGFSWRILRPLN